MLLQRFCTALILQGVLLFSLFALGHLQAFVAVIFTVLSLLAWEWAALCNIQTLVGRFLYTAIIVLFSAALCFTITGFGVQWWWLFMALILWLECGRWLYIYDRLSWWHTVPMRMILGVVILSSWVYGFYILTTLPLPFPQPAWLIFAVVMTVAAVDVGSYFSGRQWGKTKMCPNISPKKTIGGLIGGVILALVVIALFVWGWLHFSDNDKIVPIMALSLLFIIPFGVAGDLLISMLKRHVQIKDSGSFLPGHGGILDRLDGVLGVGPIFALLLLLASRYL